MQSHPLTEQLSVAAQISVDDIAAIATQGFRSIVNNRPDGEVSGQPTNAELEAAAQQAGLAWRHIPVVSGKVNDVQVRSFAEALRQLPGPVLAFCRSGNRCSVLWALQAEGTTDNILAATQAAGYDLSILRPWFEMNGRG
ncbi:MAG TPA: TIGR01244 family sulfur transferase [Rhodanobacter sp.]|nr:TIGR01244 family sulfur transferase [Rhodanobacter sp.]